MQESSARGLFQNKNIQFSAADVVAAQSGSQESFDRLAKQIRPGVLRYAAAILRDADLAEDAIQEALVDAHHHLKQLRNPEAFLVWFRRIVLKHCDRLQRRKDFRLLALSSEQLESHQAVRVSALNASTGPETAEQSELLLRYRQALRSSEFNNQERQIARLRFERNCSYEKIARDLHISTDTVKNRIRTIRRKLRYRMGLAEQACLLSAVA